MGKLFSGMGWLTAIGAGAAVAFAQYRSNQTGRDIVTVLKNLPEELKISGAEWQARLTQALAVGRQAANEREEEIESELAGQEPDRFEPGKQEVPDIMV